MPEIFAKENLRNFVQFELKIKTNKEGDNGAYISTLLSTAFKKVRALFFCHKSVCNRVQEFRKCSVGSVQRAGSSVSALFARKREKRRNKRKNLEFQMLAAVYHKGDHGQYCYTRDSQKVRFPIFFFNEATLVRRTDAGLFSRLLPPHKKSGTAVQRTTHADSTAKMDLPLARSA